MLPYTFRILSRTSKYEKKPRQEWQGHIHMRKTETRCKKIGRGLNPAYYNVLAYYLTTPVLTSFETP